MASPTQWTRVWSSPRSWCWTEKLGVLQSMGFSRQEYWSRVPLPFPEDISSLSHSVVFLYFFALIAQEGFLISPFCSLELCIQMEYLFFSPLHFASLLFTAICKAPPDSHFGISQANKYKCDGGRGWPPLAFVLALPRFDLSFLLNPMQGCE